MTIAMGDKFRDGATIMQVYGFKIAADSENQRRIMVVTSEGEKLEVDPWDLFEHCALEPTTDKDALICFRDTR